MVYQGGCLNYTNNPDDKNNYWEPHSNYSYYYCSDRYGNWIGAGHDNYSDDHADANGPAAVCVQNHNDNGGHSNYNTEYNHHSDSHIDTGHSNACGVNATYINNYSNHTNVHAWGQTTSWPLRNGNLPTDVDSWVKLSDGIQDIKDLRDDIKKISETKTKSTGAIIDYTPPAVENDDSQFGADKKARAAQINETISNLKTLWQDIQGNAGTGWPTTKTAGAADKILKNDYKILIQKAQDLASATPTYNNHNNSGSITDRNYTNDAGHGDTHTGNWAHVDNR